MTNDLISRSALIDRFDDATIEIKMDLPIQEILGEDVDIEDFFMLAQEIVQQYRKLAIDTIQKQPIAYDVEKVVEEINGMEVVIPIDYISANNLKIINELLRVVKDGAIKRIRKGGV